MLRPSRFAALHPLLLSALTLAACGDPATGSLTVLVEAEDTIIQGLQPGEGVEDIRDGWSVGFESYIAVLGPIDLHYATDSSLEAEASASYAIDLVKIPAQGVELWTIDELREGRWEFGYELSGGAHGAERHSSVDEETFATIVEEDLSYWISGVLNKTDGVSCPPVALVEPGERESVGENAAGVPCYANPSVAFELGVRAETTFGPCEIDGVPGVAVTAGRAQSATITIHGDHLFFNGFPEGSETSVTRRAQWLADSDLDLDGRVTREELEQLAPSDLSEFDNIQLGGSPIAIESLWDYVIAQLKTQGHYNGEGECPADGVEHNHDHDHDHDHEDDHDHDH